MIRYLAFLKKEYKLPIIVSGGINSKENIDTLLKSDLIDEDTYDKIIDPIKMLSPN